MWARHPVSEDGHPDVAGKITEVTRHWHVALSMVSSSPMGAKQFVASFASISARSFEDAFVPVKEYDRAWASSSSASGETSTSNGQVAAKATAEALRRRGGGPSRRTAVAADMGHIRASWALALSRTASPLGASPAAQPPDEPLALAASQLGTVHKGDSTDHASENVLLWPIEEGV